MKIIITLLVIAALIAGGIWFFKGVLAPAAKEVNNVAEMVVPQPESSESAAVPQKATAANAGDQNLSTANTPVARSKIGRKINHIYSDHNKGLDEAANE